MNKTLKIGLLIAVLALSGASSASAFSIGSRGGDVTELQAKLIEAGFDIPALTSGGAAFGYYGVQTDRANRLYQESQGAKAPILGSVSSPDIMSPYFSFGGVRQWGAQTNSLTQATTTVCALQSPVSTSTLAFGSIQLSVSSTTASVLTFAKANTAYATTTVLSTSTVAANALVTLPTASTSIATAATVALGITDRIFAPSTWLVLGMQDNTAEATAGTFSPTGTCQAVWVQN